MAGTSIQIEYDDTQVQAALSRLLAAGADLSDPMAEIGEVMLQRTKARFEAGEAPDGTPWDPLDEAYLASKRKRESRGADAILVLDDHLHGDLAYNSGDDWMELVAPQVYAATHQFGRPEAGIPARPFLGFSDDDQAEILGILREYLAEAAGI